jgi:TPR repeat protein
MVLSNENQRPLLPLFYFEGRNEDPSSSFHAFPPEVLQQILTVYAEWGDLAKLACVQKAWTPLLLDSAPDADRKWELSKALLDGTCGLEKNPELAMKLLLELANVTMTHANQQLRPKKDGDCFVPAMTKIADCYLTGTGVDEDTNQGVVWLEAAFEIGHDTHSAYRLAQMFEYGHYGIELDVVKAFQWFQKAANGGHVDAMAELGLCYELGCGTEQSDDLAMDWYMRAANQGHVTAKFSVAEAFEEARGVPQSDAEACMWYYRAAMQGDEDSKRALRRLRDIARIVVPGVQGLLDC